MVLLVQFNFLLNDVVQFVLSVLFDFVVLNATFARFDELTFSKYVRMHVVGRLRSLFWLLTFVSISFCSTKIFYFARTNLLETKGLTLEAI